MKKKVFFFANFTNKKKIKVIRHTLRTKKKFNTQMADTMAANSDGLDWSSILKPIISNTTDSTIKCDVLELCSAIVKR